MHDPNYGVAVLGAIAIAIGLVAVARRRVTLKALRSRRPARTYTGVHAIGLGCLWIALGALLLASALAELHGKR